MPYLFLQFQTYIELRNKFIILSISTILFIKITITEQRANIKFCFKLGKKFAKTYELLKKVYGDDCMSRTQVYTWFTRFKNGHDDLNDDPRSGRPETSNHAELVEKVREIIAIDANFTVRMLTEELNSYYGTNYTMLTEDLGKRKVRARLFPHQLNKDQKS